MNLSSDQWIFWQHGLLKLNETIMTTWAMMLLMTVGAMLITRHLATEGKISRWQGALEIIITTLESQIQEVGLPDPRKYLAFLGTLFIFVATCALCVILPGYKPPTGSLSTTAALALCVLLAVPTYGIREQGLGGYLKTYTQPTIIMLPFSIISELSRTLALAVRLFGNMMSGVMIIGNSTHYHTLHLSNRHDCARSAYGYGSGIHLHHSCRGLYRGRHIASKAVKRNHSGLKTIPQAKLIQGGFMDKHHRNSHRVDGHSRFDDRYRMPRSGSRRRKVGCDRPHLSRAAAGRFRDHH